MLEDLITRTWEDLGGRIGGPLSFRLVLQPLMAMMFAINAGLQDARLGHPAYLWAVLTNRTERRDLLREGWKAVGKVFVFAVIIDAVYQVMVFRSVYFVELLLVAFLLACVPYMLVRGSANRIASLRHARPRPERHP